jgi:hypothetical protein
LLVSHNAFSSAVLSAQNQETKIPSQVHAKILGIFANLQEKIFDDLFNNPDAEDEARVGNK